MPRKYDHWSARQRGIDTLKKQILQQAFKVEAAQPNELVAVKDLLVLVRKLKTLKMGEP